MFRFFPYRIHGVRESRQAVHDLLVEIEHTALLDALERAKAHLDEEIKATPAPKFSDSPGYVDWHEREGLLQTYNKQIEWLKTLGR